jgi:hypothetical protein
MFLGVAIVLVLTTGAYATAGRQVKPRRRPRPFAVKVVLPPPAPAAAIVNPVSLPPSVDSGSASGIPTQDAA